MTPTITPRLLKGFRDLLPAEALTREYLLEDMRVRFRLAGFRPIDTPILEYSDILLGKGGGESDKQLYRFTDHGGRDVGMRFDLTVPLARYIAQHRHQLTLPFRCYHIGKVFRGENTQAGRYREFVQCDFDIIGADSVHADFELLTIAIDCLASLAADIHVRISHRDLLPIFLQGRAEYQPLLTHLGDIRTIIDKRYKRGAAATVDDLRRVSGMSQPELQELTEFIDLHGQTTTLQDSMHAMHRMIPERAENSSDRAALEARLTAVAERLTESGYADNARFDPAITRGLDYYTGIIFECYDSSVENGGAICSGGRYDGLTQLYGGEPLPAVGGSIGIDRLLAQRTTAHDARLSDRHILIMMLDQADGARYQQIATALRQAGWIAEIYPQEDALNKQFRYAGTRINYGLFFHRNNDESKRYELRHLITRDRHYMSNMTEIIAFLHTTSQSDETET